MKVLGTKEKILENAGLLFVQRGYFGVSMQDIADSLGISKAALYYHFESKEALCLQLMKKTFSNLLAQLKNAVKEGRTPSEKLFKIIDGYFSFALEKPQVNLLFIREGSALGQGIGKLLVETHREIRNLLEEVFEGIVVRRKKRRERISFLTTSLFNLLGNLSRSEGLRRKNFAREIANLFL